MILKLNVCPLEVMPELQSQISVPRFLRAVLFMRCPLSAWHSSPDDCRGGSSQRICVTEVHVPSPMVAKHLLYPPAWGWGLQMHYLISPQMGGVGWGVHEQVFYIRKPESSITVHQDRLVPMPT